MFEAHTTWYSSFQVENFFSAKSVNLCIFLYWIMLLFIVATQYESD